MYCHYYNKIQQGVRLSVTLGCKIRHNMSVAETLKTGLKKYR
jgi:hypothetical protein